MSIATPPSIAITLAINPPNFKRDAHDVELSVTAVSNASYPITIFTWPNILNPGNAQLRGQIRGFDRDTAEPMEMRTRYTKRGVYIFVLGGIDDDCFFTLEPGQPISSTLRSGWRTVLPCQVIGILLMFSPVSRWIGGRREGRRMS